MRRILTTLAIGLLFLVALEAPASAHNVGGVGATDFVTKVGGVQPPLPGVTVKVIEAGSRLELRNTGPEVVVLGYQGEPYLRIGPDGTFENENSPATYLNRARTTRPQDAGKGDPSAPPAWKKISSAPVARWHDHNIHWMGTRNPPQVQAQPGARHVIFPRWVVQVQRGDTRAEVFGTLEWVPGPSPFPWWALAGALLLGTAALGLTAGWGRNLAVVLAVLLVTDLVHSTAIAFDYGGGLGTHLAKILTGSFYAIVGWVLAVLAIRLLARRNVDGLYATVFAGLSIAVFGGLLDVGTLSRSEAPFALPLWVARACVAVAIGGGVGAAVAAAIVIRRTPDARRQVLAPGAAYGDVGGAP